MGHFRVRAFCMAVAVACLCGVTAWAASNNVTVPGVADMWLAGQPAGTILNGGYPQNDVAPANSPVLASTGLNMTAGSFLTFAVTGITDYGGCASPSPDGGGACGIGPTGPALGISSVTAPLNALIGVFVDNNVPGGVAPAGLDFTSGAARSAATISPLLNQVFFIGDGLTGTGSGAVQQFVIPAGATRLFLGSFDGVGASFNNSGSFSVTVTDVPAVPTMSPVALLLLGLVLLTVGAYTLRRRTALP